MAANVLMVQGTSSSAGKSLLVTALCRIFARRGVKVAPFKGQNMSNNAAVCPDGSEIGRAQAVQAVAAGIAPSAEMNPILLKPEAASRSQVIRLGRAWRTLAAREYYRHKAELWPTVTGALDGLRTTYDLVIIEGAGSPVELNLRAGDLTNMAVALYAQAPVLLVGDIDRGGIFAQLLGTLWLLAPEEQALVRGLVVNKFRGDAGLFTDGIGMLETRGQVPVLGVIPFITDVDIPEEDSVALDTPMAIPQDAALDIAVVRLPCIANFDDFAPLAAEAGVRVRYVSTCEALGQPHAIIIPGTKSTIDDLLWLRQRGLEQAIQRLAVCGTAVVGICGGYQMLGHSIRDPEHVESTLSEVSGMGLLPVQTVFANQKTTHQSAARLLGGPGWMRPLQGQTIQGYEIHMGLTTGTQPWLEITQRSTQTVQVLDGSSDATGQIWGCYIHGLFANASLRQAWLTALGWRGSQDTSSSNSLHTAMERLADQVEASLDMAKLETIVWGS